MRGKRAAFVGVALAAALAACSLVDLSGFSGGPVADDAAIEAGPGPEAAAEAAALSDSGVDAADAADGDATFCAAAGPHTLCEDFDTPRDAGWMQFATYGGGTGNKDTVTFFSPPASYVATTPLVVDGGEAWTFPTLRVPTATTHVHVEAKVQGCSAIGEYVFVSVSSTTAANVRASIDLGMHPIAGGSEAYLTVKHDAYSKTYSLGPALPSTRFVPFVLDADLDKTSGSVKLSIDGVMVVNSASIPTDQSVAVNRRDVFTGLYAYDSPACTARIDDVIIDAR